MSDNVYTRNLKEMPASLPIFPLSGALLLPHGNLPLNIFEPRYLDMVDEALSTNRMIGMIQAKDEDTLYDIGCAGRIIDFTETQDGRYLITLHGISRFEVREELKSLSKFRRVHAQWEKFSDDLGTQKCHSLNRIYLKNVLSRYFDQNQISCDWDMFADVPDAKLITCLSMICPFTSSEKQALLEVQSCDERGKLFTQIVDLYVKEGECAGGCA